MWYSVLKPVSLMRGCLSAYGTGNAERYIQYMFQSNIWFHPNYIFFSEGVSIFHQDNAKLHGFISAELACLLSRTFRHLAHQETKRGLRTVKQPESSIRQKWDKLPRPNDRELVSSFPRCLLTVFRRRWDAKSGGVSLSQQDMLLQSNWKWANIFCF